MRILMITHIGETLGHLVRGLAIADELTTRGIKVEFAASNNAEWLLKNWRYVYPHHRLHWRWSHNSCDPNRPPLSFLSRVHESNLDVLELLKNLRPDLIIGLPGIFTTQVARRLGIPHVSILHGPYLSPIVYLKEPTPTEATVLEFSKEIFYGECVNSILSYLTKVLDLPELSYEEYLRTETIFVPQLGLKLPNLQNIHQVRFIRASFGPPLNSQEVNLKETCYITFGSGNPCDISKIVQLTRIVFPHVVVSTGNNKLQNIPNGVVTQPFIASYSLAGKIRTVISHGGIGTVGTFAEHGTPQLIIPTEIDQATMAVHASRLGIAKHCGLDSWAKDPRLGRHLPDFSEEEFVSLLQTLYSTPMHSKGIVSSGASDIASALINSFTPKEHFQLHYSSTT